MLINLSNHPSRSWSEAQKRAAHRYGQIVDVPFPPIEPTASLHEVIEQTKAYGQRCLDLLAAAQRSEPHAIHVMGEMTFVYQFVKQMTARNIPCLASTTRRIVEARAGGEKLSKFGFAQFRPYEHVPGSVPSIRDSGV